jgi:hypothetical protein
MDRKNISLIIVDPRSRSDDPPLNSLGKVSKTANKMATQDLVAMG